MSAPTIVRTNVIQDPDANNSAGWSFGGLGTPAPAAPETMVTGATDGPTLPDGTKLTTYARYTLGGPSGTGATPYVLTANVAGGNYQGDFPAGLRVATAIYMRTSVAGLWYARRWSYLLGAAAGSQQGDPVLVPANTWVRLEHIDQLSTAADYFRASAMMASGGVLASGQTVDVTAAMVTPGVDTVGPHFSGASPTVTQPDGSTLVHSYTGTPNASSSIETRVPALLSAYVEPGAGRVRLEVYGGDPGAGLYLFRRDSAGVGIVRDTSEGTAGFPSLTVEDRNLFPYPKPASASGWAGSSGVALRGATLGGEPALVASRATIGTANAWAPSAPPDYDGVAPVPGSTIRLDAEWLPYVAGSYVLRLRTYDAAGTLVQQIASSTVTIAAADLGAWRPVTLSGVVTGTTAVYARLEVTPTYSAPNLAPNPSFETDALNVLFAGSGVVTADRSTFGATVGQYALACTLMGTPNTFTWVGERTPAGAVGTWVGFSVDATWQAGSSWARAAVVFRDGSGGQLGSAVFGSYVQLTGTPQKLTATAQVPTGAVYADVIVYVYSTNAGAAPAAGTLYALDAFMATNGHATSAAAATAAATYKPPPIGDLYAVRRIVQRQAPTAPSGGWFDGDSVSADPTRGYGWEGPEDASPSVSRRRWAATTSGSTSRSTSATGRSSTAATRTRCPTGPGRAGTTCATPTRPTTRSWSTRSWRGTGWARRSRGTSAASTCT